MYCGGPTYTGLACAGHRELLEADAHFLSGLLFDRVIEASGSTS